MLEYPEREAPHVLHDPASSVPAKAGAVLRWCEAHYGRAAEDLERAPVAFRRKVHGRRYCRGYALELDTYTRHWLAAVTYGGNSHVSPEVLRSLADTYGYHPVRSAYLPPGRTLYINPACLPVGACWPLPETRPALHGSRAKVLRIGDRIRLKVPTLSGWTGTATVTEDMHGPENSVWFCKDGDDIGDPSARSCTACRHEVAVLRDQALPTPWTIGALRELVAGGAV